MKIMLFINVLKIKNMEYKNILLKINNIIDEDNPFIGNYYNKILKIRELLIKIDKKLYPYKKYYDYNKSINKLHDILNHGWYEDNYGDILEDYINKLIEFLFIIEDILKIKK